MNNIFIILTLGLLFACSHGQQNNQTVLNSTQLDKVSSSNNQVTQANNTVAGNSIQHITSTYNNPKFVDKLINHRETLKKLYDEKVFSAINSQPHFKNDKIYN
jgi:hypothetical protein